MTTETMTIHKALCELKTLDSRIKKAIEGSVFVFANKHSNAKVPGKTISAYSDEVKSAYQSACDLVARRDAIKRAVTLSNATTKVTIGGQEYTIAEAIEMKTTASRCSRSCWTSWLGITGPPGGRRMKTTASIWRCGPTSTSSLCTVASI